MGMERKWEYEFCNAAQEEQTAIPSAQPANELNYELHFAEAARREKFGEKLTVPLSAAGLFLYLEN